MKKHKKVKFSVFAGVVIVLMGFSSTSFIKADDTLTVKNNGTVGEEILRERGVQTYLNSLKSQEALGLQKVKKVDGSVVIEGKEEAKQDLTDDVGGASSAAVMPLADSQIKGTLAWSYQNSVRAFNYLSNNTASTVSFSLGSGLSVSLTPAQNTVVRAYFDWVTDNGFGLQISNGCFINPTSGSTSWWCNDSYPNRTSAVHIASAPDVWDTANSGNKGKVTVKNWSELEAIPTAFYGGWSCDYAGVARGAAWAGVGQGHK